MNRDSFQRNQDEKAKTRQLNESEAGIPPARAPLQRQGTRPLTAPLKGSDRFEAAAVVEKAASGPLTAPGAQRALIEQTLVKAEALAQGLEPRVELLMRAFQAVKMPVPGVPAMPPRHPLTPNTEKIVTYLSRALSLKPNLARQMAVAVFRFYEASEMLAFTRQGLKDDTLVEGTLEGLKQKFYYLTTYHEEFKGDPILTQVFPPPKAQGGTQMLKRPGTAPLSTMDRLREKQTQMATINQGLAMQASLAPAVALMKLTLSMRRASTARMLGAMFKPEERAASQIAKQLKGDAAAEAQLAKAVETYDQLAQALADVRGGGDTATLAAHVEAMQQLHYAMSQHPTLKALFAARTSTSRELSPPPGQR